MKLSLQRKDIDIVVTFILSVCGFLLTWIMQGTLLGKPVVSWAIFIVLPVTMYLSIRKSKPFRYILMGTFVFGCIFALILETLAEFNGAWHVVNTVFAYRFPGGASLDAIIGYALMTFLMLVVYEHFLDSPHRSRARFTLRRLGIALIPSTLVLIVIFMLIAFAPSVVQFRYLYAIAGIAAVLPAVIIGFRKPVLYSRMVRIMPYFFFVYLAFEYIAVKFSWWVYPSGEYMGYIYLFDISFPAEELFFWMLCYAAAITAFYEEWIDDGK